MNDKPQKLCFVISPIGADGSPERDAADWFLEIVREALSADYRIERADALTKSGLITAQIIQLIESANLIVADLTGHNPNVHYELGVAHARQKQVIPMMMKGDRLPLRQLSHSGRSSTREPTREIMRRLSLNFEKPPRLRSLSKFKILSLTPSARRNSAKETTRTRLSPLFRLRSRAMKPCSQPWWKLSGGF